MPKEKKFFIVETNYVGPHPSQKGHHTKTVTILSKPGRKNMSGEPCESGWLGTTDDWDRTAIGVYNEAEVRKILTETYRIKLPETSPVKYDQYSHSHRHSERYNKQHCY